MGKPFFTWLNLFFLLLVCLSPYLLVSLVQFLYAALAEDFACFFYLRHRALFGQQLI